MDHEIHNVLKEHMAAAADVDDTRIPATWIVDLIREAAVKRPRPRREERIANIACQAMKAARLH